MPKEKDRRLGWHKDIFDPRDFTFRAPIYKLPSVVILDGLLPEVRDQGNVGSCVGFGVGANLCGRDKGWNQFVEWYSPTWIYNGARYIEGTLGQDNGCYPRDALHWLYEKGCLLESLWPYDPTKLDTAAPPSHLEPEAAKRPLLSYYRVVDGVDGICAAINEGHFVSIGTPWFEKWVHKEPFDGNLEEVSSTDWVAGGHETCLYGYDQIKQVVHGINSWGGEWGNGGLYTMPFSAFDVFKQRGGYDAHFIGFEAAPEEPEDADNTSPCQIARLCAFPLNLVAAALRRKTRLKPVKIA